MLQPLIFKMIDSLSTDILPIICSYLSDKDKLSLAHTASCFFFLKKELVFKLNKKTSIEYYKREYFRKLVESEFRYISLDMSDSYFKNVSVLRKAHTLKMKNYLKKNVKTIRLKIRITMSRTIGLKN